MNQILKKLSENIKLRKRLSSEKSYTSYLINAGTKECSKKFGEEALELIIAANNEDLDAFTSVMFRSSGVPPSHIEHLTE